jgi:tetratricopeptide (TPR) repeat protein
MNRNFSYYVLIFFGIILFQSETIAQNEKPTDDLGNVSDAFQENFFEALKQKGIENYELALKALDRAEIATKEHPENLSVICFERAKNFAKLKRYDEAESFFKKVLETETNQLDVMEALYDLYYIQRDYEAAIPLIVKLIPFDEDYKEDLANLYHRTKQYDKALDLLDELDVLWGESTYRDALRTRIYRATGNSDKEIENLENKINNKTKNEKEYLNLIFLYSDQGNSDKAFETANELLKEFPKSQLVHLALYKFYLDKDNAKEAIQSMKVVFKSSNIDAESKYKVLSDFISFVNSNPQYEIELEEVVSLFSEENNSKVYETIGDYFLNKKKKEQALIFYEKGIEKDNDNFSLIKSTLLLQIDFKKYDDASNLCVKALEIFPAQALLYLINGVANNGLNAPELAIENLEIGLDFLLDNPKMEHDFYQQLSIAYQAKGNSKKADFYKKKASELSYSN